MIEHLRGRDRKLEPLGWTGQHAEWITMIGLVLIGLGLLSAQNRAVFGPPVAAPACPSAPQGPARNFRFVCFDLESGGYLVRYARSLETGIASDTDAVEFRIELRDLSDPKIEVHVNKLAATGEYVYIYELENGSAGRRPIESWAVVTAGEDDSVVLDHPRWRKTTQVSANPVVAPQAALTDGLELRRNATMGRFARWSTSLDEYPIRVGGRATGFVVKSRFRPGWTTAYVGAGRPIPWRSWSATTPRTCTAPSSRGTTWRLDAGEHTRMVLARRCRQ